MAQIIPTEQANAAVEAIDKEALVARNPHSDFAAVEAARPPFPAEQVFEWSKTPNPNWKIGQGANDETKWKENTEFVAIDPKDPKRIRSQNYKIMISSCVPRPIALASTVTADGKTLNLAPFSYFQCVCTNPPLYSLSLCGEIANDTLRNVLETGEIAISIINENFIEAANYTSVNTPPSISEWTLSGLTQRPSEVIKPPHVAESVFSIEGKLHSKMDFNNPAGVHETTVVFIEAVRWHARSDAINEDQSVVDLSVLRPVWRGGGITYGTSFQAFELPRPEAFRIEKEKPEVAKLL